MDIKKIIVLVIGVLALIFCAACTGGNNWLETTIPIDTEITLGLWKACSSLNGICVSTEDAVKAVGQTVPGWYLACRAMTILSCVGIVTGLFLTALGIFIEKIKGFFASVFLFDAAICMAIALSVYAIKNDVSLSKISRNYGWSFILGWIGVVAAGVSGLISIFA